MTVGDGTRYARTQRLAYDRHGYKTLSLGLFHSVFLSSSRPIQELAKLYNIIVRRYLAS